MHYEIPDVYPGINAHQPLDLARQARDRMLQICGFDLSHVTEAKDLSLRDPDKQRKPATIAYTEIDPYGRVVAFVFVKDMGFQVDDTHPTVFLDPKQIEASVNLQLLQEGLVYPTFYGTLYPELRASCVSIAQQARAGRVGVWGKDITSFQSARKPHLSEVDDLVILPKIFRRLSTHIARNGAVSNFKAYLAEVNDVTVDTRQIRLTGLQAFVTVEENSPGQYRMNLLRNPEELIFQTS